MQDEYVYVCPWAAATQDHSEFEWHCCRGCSYYTRNALLDVELVLIYDALFSKTMITLELKSYVVLLLLYMPISYTTDAICGNNLNYIFFQYLYAELQNEKMDYFQCLSLFEPVLYQLYSLSC